jgi:hypothetical protein
MVLAVFFLSYTATFSVRAVTGFPSFSYSYFMVSEERNGQLGPPWPVNPYPGLTATSLGNGNYLVDDTTVVQAKSMLQELSSFSMASEDSGPPTLGGGYTNYVGGNSGSGFITPQFASNDFYLTIYGPPTYGLEFLTIHGTIEEDLYEIWGKTDLLLPAWTPLLIERAPIGTNAFDVYVDASSTSNQFYRAQHSTVALAVADSEDAVKPTPYTTLHDGIFQIYITQGYITSNLTVYYRISGTASNGYDYTYLTGSLTLSAGAALVTVHPLWHTNYVLDQTVTLTLIPTNTYLITPSAPSATMTIRDYAFETVTNLPGPIGLDYDPVSHSLIASVHYDDGEPYCFSRIFTNPATGALIVTNWSGVHHLLDEVQQFIVKTNAGVFAASDMYFGTGTNGIIGKLSSGGTVSNLNWVTLTSDATGTDTLLRGGLYVDQTGVFDHDMIAVTGNGTREGGGIWKIHSPSNFFRLAYLENTHLEGVVTLPNDTNWGPWAGKIITGWESKPFAPPEIYAIDTNGVIMTNFLGIAPEHFDIIPTNQDFYFINYDDRTLMKLHKEYFSNYVGDLLITQAGEYNGPPGFFVVRWNPANTNFSIHSISGFGSSFEQSSFAPISLPSQ